MYVCQLKECPALVQEEQRDNNQRENGEITCLLIPTTHHKLDHLLPIQRFWFAKDT